MTAQQEPVLDIERLHNLAWRATSRVRAVKGAQFVSVTWHAVTVATGGCAVAPILLFSWTQLKNAGLVLPMALPDASVNVHGAKSHSTHSSAFGALLYCNTSSRNSATVVNVCTSSSASVTPVCPDTLLTASAKPLAKPSPVGPESTVIIMHARWSVGGTQHPAHQRCACASPLSVSNARCLNEGLMLVIVFTMAGTGARSKVPHTGADRLPATSLGITSL